MFWDPWGLERVVLSAGAYNNNKDKKYQFEFIDTALKQIELWLEEGIDPSEIGWLITNLGWSDQQITDIEEAASSYGVNFTWINGVDDITSYINTGGLDGSETDTITHFSVFSHGLKDNGGTIALGYGHDTTKNLSWGISDLDNLNASAFDKTISWFYSCRTGRAGGGKSFAHHWANLTNGATYAVLGINGRTDYSYINGGPIEKAFSDKRATWKEQRGSYDKPGASYQLPGLSLPGSGWGLFTPGLKYALPVVGH